MRNALSLLTAGMMVVLAASLPLRQTQAQEYPAPIFQSGSDLLAAVSSLRISNGLPAYAPNPILMQIAQAQADYMAATGGIYGHSGPDGSTPKQRAVAAGYSAVFFSENWQAGIGLSPSDAVLRWQGDAPHLTTMLSPSLVEAGAGVSKAGNVIYYVLDAGSQGSSSVAGDPAVIDTTVPAGTPKPSQFMVPVIVSTPNMDGLVYHEVAYGQTLWSLAIAYETRIEAIQTLNGLVGLDIYPGQKLLISALGATPLPMPSAIEEAGALPTTTGTTAGLVSTPTLSFPTLVLPTLISSSDPEIPPSGRLNLTVIVIIGAALLFAALGAWMGTRKPV